MESIDTPNILLTIAKHVVSYLFSILTSTPKTALKSQFLIEMVMSKIYSSPYNFAYMYIIIKQDTVCFSTKGQSPTTKRNKTQTLLYLISFKSMEIMNFMLILGCD